jgi:arginine decarboxylase
VIQLKADEWSLDRSRQIYGLAKNDLYFLDVNDSGDLMIRFRGHSITVKEVIERVETENSGRPAYTSSFTLRMPQLIQYQVMKLKSAFRHAIKNLGYEGSFKAVYPIKVNQRADSIIPILKADPNYGLEVGTKSELLLVKSLVANQKQRLIICNGTKDREYLDIIKDCASEGYKLGISIESSHEARLITDLFEPLTTNLILRIKPYVTARGRWSHSGGRESKFGLTIQDLLDVVGFLKEESFSDCVTTVFGHVGSQVTAIDDFQPFAAFMTHAFYDIRDLGLKSLKTIDFGGGLPTDYTSSFPSNIMLQYASSIIRGIRQECSSRLKSDVVPDIMVESGRALTAPGSLIVVKALEVRSVYPSSGDIPKDMAAEKQSWAKRIKDSVSVDELVRVWKEFSSSKSSVPLHLPELRTRENLVGAIRSEIRKRIAALGMGTPEIDPVVENIWSPDYIVIGNFSVFNCAADHVVANQYFPVMPIKDLNVRPETTVRIVDITCDSDGEISQFNRKGTGKLWLTSDNRPIAMPNERMGTGIPVGSIKNVQGSYFVFALTGAYQDIIQMDHNLLGDLPDVVLVFSRDGKWKISWASDAETIHDILEHVGYTGMEFDEDPYMNVD